jgi:hypothetical protein
VSRVATMKVAAVRRGCIWINLYGRSILETGSLET